MRTREVFKSVLARRAQRSQFWGHYNLHVEKNIYHTTGLFISLLTFFENTITPSFCYWIVWYFGMLPILMSYQRHLFYILKKLTTSGQKNQICEHNLNFCTNFFTALINLHVFVWDSPQEKLQVLKNHQKAKIWVCWKSVFFVYYFILKG